MLAGKRSPIAGLESEEGLPRMMILEKPREQPVALMKRMMMKK